MMGTMTTHKKVSSKGGKAGTGEAKRRPREHYIAIAKKRWDKVRAAKAEANQHASNL
jgi:hypothetical protein